MQPHEDLNPQRKDQPHSKHSSADTISFVLSSSLCEKIASLSCLYDKKKYDYSTDNPSYGKSFTSVELFNALKSARFVTPNDDRELWINTISQKMGLPLIKGIPDYLNNENITTELELKLKNIILHFSGAMCLFALLDAQAKLEPESSLSTVLKECVDLAVYRFVRSILFYANRHNSNCIEENPRSILEKLTYEFLSEKKLESPNIAGVGQAFLGVLDNQEAYEACLQRGRAITIETEKSIQDLFYKQYYEQFDTWEEYDPEAEKIPTEHTKKFFNLCYQACTEFVEVRTTAAPDPIAALAEQINTISAPFIEIAPNYITWCPSDYSSYMFLYLRELLAQTRTTHLVFKGDDSDFAYDLLTHPDATRATLDASVQQFIAPETEADELLAFLEQGGFPFNMNAVLSDAASKYIQAMNQLKLLQAEYGVNLIDLNMLKKRENLASKVDLKPGSKAVFFNTRVPAQLYARQLVPMKSGGFEYLGSQKRFSIQAKFLYFPKSYLPLAIPEESNAFPEFGLYRAFATAAHEQGSPAGEQHLLYYTEKDSRQIREVIYQRLVQANLSGPSLGNLFNFPDASLVSVIIDPDSEDHVPGLKPPQPALELSFSS